MATYTLPYGKGERAVTLPDGLEVVHLAPREAPAAADPAAVVAAALDNPIGSPTLSRLARGARSAAIAINDKTRPVPHDHLLPPLLAMLEEAGMPASAITLIIATGTHPPMLPEEFPAVVPAPILSRYRVISHDASDAGSLVDLGTTSRGTQVRVNRHYAATDLRIVVGNIEPHQFVGFSGGVKTAVIGLGGRETITANHSMMMDPKSQIGRYDDNPARQDIEEAGELLGVHFALNAVLNGGKQITHALAGSPRLLMPAGIDLVRRVFQVEVEAPFDLMIVSPGGHPKDINVYQTQKGLGHASLVTRPGGEILLLAACPEGTGSKGYEAWMLAPGRDSYTAVIEQFRAEGFRIGPHKAYQIARDASRCKVSLLSELPQDFSKRLLLEPIADLDQAIEAALARLGPGARIGIMPRANATIPVLKG